LDLIHLSIVPEVYLDPARNVTFRFGLQVGLGSIARVTGESLDYGSGQEFKEFENERSYDFGADLRLLLGLGLRIPLQGRVALSLDPYASAGLSSIVHTSPRNICMEWGIRLGASLSSPGDGFWMKRREKRALRKAGG
jgi:hypothetical protein